MQPSGGDSVIPFDRIDPKWVLEQHPEEIRPFASWLTKVLPNVGRVVELGVRHGGTSALWLELFPRAHVIGVDRIGPDSYQEPEFSSRAAAMSKQYPRYTFIEGDTAEPRTLARVTAAAVMIDFLFIDADHSYEAVKRDFTRFEPLVRIGGVVAFHDIVDSPRTGGGVAKLWRELTGDKHEFVCGSDWGGIGALLI